MYFKYQRLFREDFSQTNLFNLLVLTDNFIVVVSFTRN